MRHEGSETDAGNKADSSASNSSCNDQRTYIKISEHEDDNMVEKQLKDSESSPDNKINGKVRSSVTSPPTRVFTRTSSKKNIKPELEESDVAMEFSPGAERSASSDKVSSPGTTNKHSLKACTHCGTTKTPLWRMGPSGPKSLCNACGIRFKKTGQPPELDTNPALTLAANQSEKSPKRKADGAVTGVLPKKCRSPTRVKKETAEVVNGVATSENILSWRHSSGLKFAATRRSCTRRSISGTDNPLLDRTHEDDTLNRAKSKFTSSSRFRSSALRVAQDEEEGAALLLALSYGLVNA